MTGAVLDDAVAIRARAKTSVIRNLSDGRRAFPLLALAGAASATFVVIAGGEVGPVRGSVPLSRWIGLLEPAPVNPDKHPLPGIGLLIGLLMLVGCWLLAQISFRSCAWTPRRLWTLFGAWALPLVLGPPLLSSDVFAYAAQGMMAARGQDPYTQGIAKLGSTPAVAAVDPVWRNVKSPYGPVATALEHGAFDLGGGNALGAVLVLRFVAVVSVIAIGLFAMQLAGRHRRAMTFGLTALNPIVLLQVVSAAHFEGVLGALLLASLVALRKQQTHLALFLGCAAGLVKAPALVVLAVIVFDVWRRTEPGHRVRLALTMTATVAVSALALASIVPDGWGWIPSMTTPGLGYTPDAPATVVALLLTPFVVWTHLVPATVLTTFCRVAALWAAAMIVGWLLATSRKRPPANTAGWSLLAVSVLGPVIYPWYFLWGLLCLAPGVWGRMRNWLVMLSVVGSLMTIQGLSVATIATLASVIVVVMVTWIVRAVRSSPQPAGVPSQRAHVQTSREPTFEAAG